MVLSGSKASGDPVYGKPQELKKPSITSIVVSSNCPPLRGTSN